MAGDWIEQKLRQAEYHLSKIKGNADELEVASSFSAFATCVRSTVMYVESWAVNNNRVANKNAFWSRFDQWLGGQAPEDVKRWRALTSLRNVDIHEQPIDPESTTEYIVRPLVGVQVGLVVGVQVGIQVGHRGIVGTKTVLRVTDPRAGTDYDVLDVCDGSLRIARALLVGYGTL